MPSPQPQPPDSLGKRPTEMSEVRRAQALACQAIITLPGDAAKLAAQKVEMEARALVMAIDPETATEAEMRCRLAKWQHASNVFTMMSDFVRDTNRLLEEAAKTQALEKLLSKPL